MVKIYKIKEPLTIGYYITKDGRVYNKEKSTWLKQRLQNGYYTVNINKYTLTVHRLVAKTFIPNPENKPYVDHIDSNKTNNKLENLRWCTQQENCSYHGKQIDHPRQVIQLDKDENEINRFNSLIEASKEISLTPDSISKVLAGKNQTAGGYKWKYENQENEKDELDESQGKIIEEFPNYMIFRDGTVYNLIRKKKLKPVKNHAGNLYVTLNSRYNRYIGNLVATTYIPNPKNRKYIKHLNENAEDNRVENLEWK